MNSNIKTILKNKKFYIALLITAGIILGIVLNLDKVSGFFSWLSNVFYPIILGGCIAFVLSVIMGLFSDYIFKNLSNQRLKNILSLLCSLILVVIIIIAVIWIVVPQLLNSFKLLYDNIIVVLNEVISRLEVVAKNNPNFMESLNNLKSSTGSFEKSLGVFFKTYLPGTLTSTVSLVVTSFKSLMSFLIALLFALYILLSRKQLEKTSRSICYAFFKEKVANQILYVFHLLKDYFTAFIYGRVASALCLAIIYAVAALLFRLPNTLMMATIFAVFSIIPLFGALIGWIVGLFIIGTTGIYQAIAFTIIFVIDLLVVRNLIYPKLIGKSLGLPDLWVMFAVIVGGKAFGILGMLTAVPIFALIYTLIKEAILRRVNNNSKEAEDILNKPNWDTFNPLTSEYEGKPYKLDNPLDKNLNKE